MRRKYFFLSSLLLIVFAVLALISSRLASWAGQPEGTGTQFSDYVDAKGNIRLPLDYRKTFLHMGTFSIASAKEGVGPELHGVYARPQDIEAFKRDGKFPDGAVLVKDVYTTASEKLSTGQVSWSKDIKVWFVMIKDTKGRFPDNDLWGDGWGWALFEGQDPSKQVATDYRSDCRTCHVPARKNDWLYLGRLPLQ